MPVEAVIAILSLWAAVSVGVHVTALQPTIRRLDLLALVPQWNFFAPRPAEGDYHLLYRDLYIDGVMTEWTEIAVASPRRWWNALWNPGKRPRKALFDAVTELAAQINAYGPHELAITMSVPYLSILGYVSALPRSAAAQQTQFMLVLSHGLGLTREPDVLLRSEAHDL